MNSQITFSQALEGYLLYADASRLSPHTIADYTNTFRKFQDFLSDDPPINEITADQVRQFMAAQDHIMLMLPDQSEDGRPGAGLWRRWDRMACFLFGRSLSKSYLKIPQRRLPRCRIAGRENPISDSGDRL